MFNESKLQLTGTLVYVCVQQAVKAFQKPGTDPKPDEWKASVVFSDEDEFDKFEEYVNNIGGKVSMKKVKTAEFPNIYRTEVPEGAGKNVWVVTLRKSTELGKTGEKVPEKYKPRVFEKIGNKIVEITNEKLVGNGSVGQVSIEKFDRRDGTSSLYLKNVLVTELVEYVVPEGVNYVPGSEFDDSEDDSTEVVVKQEPKVTKSKPVKVLDANDDVPF